MGPILDLTPDPARIQVLAVDTLASPHGAARFERYLSGDELRRADAFHYDHLRRTYVVTRGVLRLLLGLRAGVPPASLSFSYGPNGKPALDRPGDIRFNATHSGGLAAFAFATGLEVGVDLESIRPINGIEDVVERFFCPEEAAEVLGAPEQERTSAFYRCWTRKEAYIKAKGGGLSIPLDSFRVSLEPGDGARFVHEPPGRYAAEGWQLHDLSLAPSFAAALAYEGPRREAQVAAIFTPEDLFANIEQGKVVA